jgi:hypothetical protein
MGVEAEEEKGKNLQESTRQVKDRKAFPIWLMQPDA